MRRLGRATVAFVLTASLGIAAAAGIHRLAESSSLPAAQGAVFDHPVPTTRLIDEHGNSLNLRLFHGRVVVVAPFLTLCGEMCPMTTGALLQVRHDLVRAGLASRVSLVEVSVDPWRDSPRRLAAYAAMTHLGWTLLTGTRAALSQFWQPFGVWFKRTRPANSPPTDWLTHRPQTMDVAHTNGVFVIDQRGVIRYFLDGPASTGGTLPRDLERLLTATGRQNLQHPVGPWTVNQLLDDVGRLIGRRIPALPLH